MNNSIDKRFDKQLENVPNLTWLPWVGKDYNSAHNGKRLLVLGESHYVPIGEDAKDGYNDIKWTRNFISKEGLKQPPLYTGNPINPLVNNTERSIYLSKNITDENKQRLWHSVSFFNLIQRLLNSRFTEDRPNSDDYIFGWQVFLNVIDIIKPNACLVLGKSGFGPLCHVINNVVRNWVISVEKSNLNERFIVLSKNNYKLKLVFIRHPSSYFSWKKWGALIENELPEFNALKR